MSINLAVLGIATKTWVYSSSSSGFPLDDAAKLIFYDGDRNTAGILGGSIGARSGTTTVTAKLTFPSAVRIDRIYVKTAAAAEEGGHGNCESLSMAVYVNEASVHSVALSQNAVTVWDDTTVREGTSSVWWTITASYSRPSDENNSGFAFINPYEFEVWGDFGDYGVML
jgi:hypothetical protein